MDRLVFAMPSAIIFIMIPIFLMILIILMILLQELGLNDLTS